MTLGDLVKQYYHLGLYKDEDLNLFVSVNWITAADYKELTGKDYVA